MTRIAVYTPSQTITYELNATSRAAIAWAEEEIEAVHPDWDEYEIFIELTGMAMPEGGIDANY